MKDILRAVLIVILVSSVCFADNQLDQQSEEIKASYSVGYKVGSDFKRQGVDINPEVVLKGVLDALQDKEPLMNRGEMRATLVDLKKTVAAAQQKEMEAEAEKNLAKGLAFLTENSKKKEVQTLQSGLQFKIITTGSGNTPKADDSVVVHYRGTLIDGTEFDSSYKRGKPAIFRVDRVISGWTEALQLMKEGSRWQLFIPPKLAYGQKRTGSIAPNSTLLFDVELIAFQSGQ